MAGTIGAGPYGPAPTRDDLAINIVSMLLAIVFDFDGVIADTEPLHHRAFADVLDGTMRVPTWERYLAEYLGLNDQTFLRRLFRESGESPADEAIQLLLDKKDAAYRKHIARGLPLLPGVEQFIGWARERFPLAICSGARRVEIETILRQADLLDAFEHIVSADEVSLSKPDPAGFLRAIELLAAQHGDLRPATCLAIEDSAHGIAAAKRVGMRVVQVCPHAIGAPAIEADRQIRDLTELDEEALAQIMA